MKKSELNSKTDIRDIVNSFESACEVLRLDPTKLPDVSFYPKVMRRSLIAYYKLTIIAMALREDWVPDFLDFNEPKYFPVFYIYKLPAGVGLAFSGARAGVSVLFSNLAPSYSYAHYGGALASRTREIARYFGEQFVDLWKEYLIPDLSK